MSTLTKIFVVLLVVFCIAFSMTSIAFVARTHEWRDLATKYQQEAHIADTYVRNCLAESAAQKALDRDAINAHINRINDLETQQQDVARELAEAEGELAQTRAEGSSLQGIIRTLTGELKVGQAGWSEERKQREQLLQRNLDLERRNLDLNERVNEQTAQLMVLQQELRRREQQVGMLRADNTALAQGPSRLTDFEAYSPAQQERVAPLTEVSGAPIRGHVTEVSGALASISVGSADGVAEGMVFVVYRGMDYVGDLEVSKVEPNQAAGTLVRTSGTVLVGDQVADEARFGLAR